LKNELGWTCSIESFFRSPCLEKRTILREKKTVYHWTKQLYCFSQKETITTDYIIRLITLSVITLSGAHCILFKRFKNLSLTHWSLNKFIFKNYSYILRTSSLKSINCTFSDYKLAHFEKKHNCLLYFDFGLAFLVDGTKDGSLNEIRERILIKRF
jgi:hypothetical protein